ncbi:unnamed protein product [Brassica rapa subsp. trilocularis]
MRAALQAAALLNVTHLRMFSDNQTLIRAINVKLFEEKKIYGIVKDIEATFLLCYGGGGTTTSPEKATMGIDLIAGRRKGQLQSPKMSTSSLPSSFIGF